MTNQTYIAKRHAQADGAPVIVGLHGTGGDETQFFGLIRQISPLAGIVSPRGDVSEMGANRFFRRTGEGVYDMDDLSRATDKMAAFLRAEKAANPGAPFYGFGYSNGANILAAVSFLHPDLFDRIALLHPLIPWMPEPQPALQGRPVLITAGRRDPIGPWPRTEALIGWYEEQGATVTTHVHEGGHELQEGEVQALASLLNAPLQAAA